MQKILLLIFVIVMTTSCNSQKNSYLEKNFIFIIELYPSFTAPCRIIFQNENNSKTLSINIFYDKEHLQYLNDKNNLKPEKTDTLLIDDWFKKYLGDTVYFKHLETIQVVDNEFQKFVDSLDKIDLTKQKSLEKDGILDGIDVAFRFKTDSIDNRFSFLCPDPEDSTEFTIIKAIFNLLEHSYKLESTNNYIEILKGYFDFGLCVKRMSDNPLEYRFYSHLSSNEADEFYKLMESLPRDKPVIFDFSNFGGMGTMFYDDFEDFIEENPNVYWIVNNHTIKQINEIGVEQNRIFNNRDDVIKVIKRKNNQ
jgi:hypothetical protein